MKRVTSVTVWNDSIGSRISVTYSEIDEVTHKIINDNVRTNFIATSQSEIDSVTALIGIAQTLVDSEQQ